VTALLVLCFAWPLPLQPSTRILGPTQADFYSIAWGLDHVARHLAEGQLPPLHTTRLEWPRGAQLLVADLPEAVLLAPVTLLAGPVLAFNLLQLLHHALAAAAAWWCAGALGLGRAGRAIAALAFGFAPALVGTSFNQNPDVSAWYWLPLTAGLAATARSPGRAALAGSCAGLAAWCNPYGAVMCLVALLLLLPGRELRRWAAALGPLLLLGGGAALLAWWTVKDPSSAVHKPLGTTLHGAASWKDLLKPWPTVHTNREWQASQFVHGAYLGWSLLLAGTAGLWRARRWRWLALAALAVLMSLGPQIPLARWALPNPLWALEDLRRMWHFHRYSALAVLVLGMGAGMLAQQLGRRGWLLLPLVAADLLLLGGAYRLLRSVPVFEDGACELMAQLPAGPQYDAPPGDHELWLFASACHGNPVTSGINRPLSRELTYRLKHPSKPGLQRQLEIMREQGIRWIVYHPTGPRGAVNDVLFMATAHCEVTRNELGVRVHDLHGCSVEAGASKKKRGL